MRTFTQVAALVAGAAAVASSEDCNYALEIALVQDGTTSFDDLINEFSKSFSDFVAKVKENYKDTKIGIASFTDKPTPLRGLGKWGGWDSSAYSLDYCYKRHSRLTSDFEADEAETFFADLRNSQGSGGDMPENPFEGMIYAAADSGMGWSPASKTHTEEGLPIARIVLVVTDDLAHTDTYLAAGEDGALAAWHYPRDLSNPTAGGFGSANPVIVNALSPDVQDTYLDDLVPLFEKIDNNEELTDDEKVKMEELLNLTGPYPWPKALEPNPHDGSRACEEVEYPNPQEMGKIFEEKNIFPIVLVNANSIGSSSGKDCKKLYNLPYGTECLVKYFEDSLQHMSVPSTVMEFDPENVYEAMTAAINELVSKTCLRSTETPTSTESTSTESTSTETTTESTATDGSTDTTEAGAGPVPVPPVPTPDNGSSGSKKGTIIGAAAGGAGALLAAGGALYGKASLFARPSVPSVEATNQVEMPENTVERETMEEVTMDMFQ